MVLEAHKSVSDLLFTISGRLSKWRDVTTGCSYLVRGVFWRMLTSVDDFHCYLLYVSSDLRSGYTNAGLASSCELPPACIKR
jgi:hypothetical protein